MYNTCLQMYNWNLTKAWISLILASILWIILEINKQPSK